MSPKTGEPSAHTASSVAGDIAGSEAQRELLRRLELDINRRLDGMLHGDYRGLVPGQGSELGEARVYQPGDDVRRIDWNVTARTQQTHIRESIADRELETHILVDLSPSLDFGTAEREKRDLVLIAAVAVGFLTARVGNRIGAVLQDAGGLSAVPARQGRTHLLALLQRVMDSPRGQVGTTDLAAGIERLARQARRRGLTVVISDFLSPSGWELGIQRLHVRHDVLAIELIDPRELELPDVGLLALVDPETGARREIPTGNAKLRARYAEAAAAQREATAASIRSAGADHLVLRTDTNWILDIARFVSRRNSRSQSVPRSSA